jgi:hypothetical protein
MQPTIPALGAVGAALTLLGTYLLLLILALLVARSALQAAR